MTKNGAISAGHARALLAFDNPAMMLEAANQIVSRKLTVRDVEKMARSPRRAASRSRNARRDSFYNEVELSLAETLGRKVKVVNSGKGGTLQIEFYSPEDLKNIANALYKED